MNKMDNNQPKENQTQPNNEEAKNNYIKIFSRGGNHGFIRIIYARKCFNIAERDMVFRTSGNHRFRQHGKRQIGRR